MSFNTQMEQYVVGGAVRDVLLGIPPKDIDYVWVNSTKDHLLSLGLKEVEGNNLTVFHDADLNQHLMLPAGATLESDLYRRDLTINAMAVNVKNWSQFLQYRRSRHLIDLMFGSLDIERLVASPVSHTIYSDDPLRIIRTARQVGKLNLSVREDHLQLMKDHVNLLSSVPPDRIWAEVQKFSFTPLHFKRTWQVLQTVGAITHPVLSEYFAVASEAMADQVRPYYPIAVNLCLLESTFTTTTALLHRVPTHIPQFLATYRESVPILAFYPSAAPSLKLQLFQLTRAYHQSASLLPLVLEVFLQTTQQPDVITMVYRDLNKVLLVDAGKIAGEVAPPDIALTIRNARIEALL